MAAFMDGLIAKTIMDYRGLRKPGGFSNGAVHEDQDLGLDHAFNSS